MQPTGMFVPWKDINSTGVNVFFAQGANVIPADENHTRDINLTLDLSHITTMTDAVQKSKCLYED